MILKRSGHEWTVFIAGTFSNLLAGGHGTGLADSEYAAVPPRISSSSLQRNSCRYCGRLDFDSRASLCLFVFTLSVFPMADLADMPETAGSMVTSDFIEVVAQFVTAPVTLF